MKRSWFSQRKILFSLIILQLVLISYHASFLFTSPGIKIGHYMKVYASQDKVEKKKKSIAALVYSSFHMA